MQYDENAEKYGYEGEMTPIECDKLQAYKGDVTIPVYGTIADAEVYLKKDVDAVIAKLKQKLEDVQASMYCDVVDANMENRRLKRALFLARTEWARSAALSYHLLEDHPNKDAAATYRRKANKWEKVQKTCAKYAEKIKGE